MTNSPNCLTNPTNQLTTDNKAELIKIATQNIKDILE